MKLKPEDVDLAELADALILEISDNPPVGYLEGRTLLRDMVGTRLGCSDLEAEEIVDTMVGRGFLRFNGDPEGAAQPGFWRVDATAP